MSNERLNFWSKLEFKNPSRFLAELRPLQLAVAASNLPEAVKSLRTHTLRRHGEARDAALVSVGMRKILRNDTLQFAMHEDQDYDFVTRRIENDVVHYTPVQLKVLVSEQVNQRGSIEAEIAKLKKYSASQDLVVVFRVVGEGRIDFASLFIPQLSIGELWVLGTVAPDQSRWCLVGDLLKKAETHVFDYPLTA